jgi:hypothetical protein
MKKMKKLIFASLLSGLVLSGFASPLSSSLNERNAGSGAQVFCPVAVATYKSKCGDVWDFVIPYTNLRQLPGYLTQMMNDADRACGTNISYFQY